jgi:hypothetical protein
MPTNQPPAGGPNIEWVLTATDDWAFKKEAKDAAATMDKVINDVHAAFGEAAKMLFNAAHKFDMTEAELNAALAPLTKASDHIEAAGEEFIKTLVSRPKAYVKPPAGVAEKATIIASPPVSQV